MSQIAIINASQAVKDDEVRKCADALQTQVNSHFRPQWGVDAELTFFTHADAAAGKIPAGSWWLAVLDDSDTAGALGYHDRPAARPRW